MDDVVVWNLDARHRPELEVEIELVREVPRPPALPKALTRRPTATKLDELFVDDLA